MKSRGKLRFASFGGLWLLISLALAAPAQGAAITGVADENLETWTAPTWSALATTGVTRARHIVPWDAALKAGPLKEAEDWIAAAESHGLEVLISFNHNDVAPPPVPWKYVEGMAKFRQKFPQVAYYTAWNEPNHSVKNKSGVNPNNNPTLAAEYWHAANDLCHQPELGPTCTVIAGDFSDETTTEGLKNYVTTYKNKLTSYGESPGTWAVHAYKALRNNSSQMLQEAFVNQIGAGKPFWITEAAGMNCETSGGFTGPGGPGDNQQTADATQNAQAQNYLNLFAGNGNLKRSYWYHFAENPGAPCDANGGPWDSGLINDGQIPRPAFKTIFPSAGNPPSVQTAAATNVGPTQATLNGSLDPRGFHTSYHFEWGTTTNYTNSVPVPDAYAGFSGSIPESAAIGGLLPGTTYHYRLVASNPYGTTAGGDQVFTTPNAAESSLNGDGKADLVECVNNQYLATMSDGSQFGPPKVWSEWGCGPLARLGDFNGDGKNDLLAPGGGTSWAVGQSDGSKFNGSIWSTGVTNSPTWLGVGDFNGDGEDDFATCLNSEYKVNLSTGSSFQTGTTVWSTWGCGSSVRVGDFNGDGMDDIIVPAGGTSWVVGQSDGKKFNGSIWSTGVTNSPTWLGVGDFNGDGEDDFATCLNSEYKVNLSTGSALGAGTVWSTWGCGPLADIGDFSGDGKDDLIVPGANTSWAVGVSSGSNFNGTGTQGWLFGFTNQPTWRGAGPLNGDGKADLVECVNNQYLATMSDGSQFGPPKVWSEWGCGPLARLGDFNGDGKNDLLAPGGGTSWAVGVSSGSNFNGTGTQQWTTGVTNSPTWLGVGDFNGDGEDDFATCLNSEYKVNLSTGSSFQTGTTVWSTWGCGSSVRVGDFNGDGMDDIIVPAGGTSWVVGQSDGKKFNGLTWTTSVTNSPTWLGVGDFNGDGEDDFATCLNSEYKVNLSTGSALGAGTVWSTWGCGPLADIGDFSGDGKDDLIVPGANTSWAVGVSSGSNFNGTGTQGWLFGFTNQPTWRGAG